MGLNSPSEMVRQGLLAEKHGFEWLWFPDHFVSATPTIVCPEVWAVITAIGIKTKHAMLSTGVTDPFRRHPATIAQIVATLDRLLNGRMALGIGAGEAMNLTPFGISCIEPIRSTREAIECIRLLWSATPETPANYKGKFYRLVNAFLTIKPVQTPHPPIYIGALGPRMREMVGELADGWYTWIITPELYKKGLKDIERGCKRAGRSMNEIDAVPRFYSAIADSDKKIESEIVSISKWALVQERRILKSLGHKISIPGSITIQRVLSSRESDFLIKEFMKEVPMEAVEAISVFGTIDDCIEKIERYVKLGARHIGVYNVGSDETLKSYQKIISYFKGK